MDYLGYIKADSEGNDDGLRPYRVVIFRDFTVEPLLPVIRAECRKMGASPSFYLSGYDGIADALRWDNEVGNPDCVIIARFGDWASGGFREVIESIRSHTKCPILINNCYLDLYADWGILEAQFPDGAAYEENIALIRLSKKYSDVYVVDYTRLIRDIDRQKWESAMMPLAAKTLVDVGREYATFIRAFLGKSKKCLVLDADNTLWKGIIGEDGIGGIAPYRSFQDDLLTLYDRGVLLAICSKNNESDVLDVLRNRPDMVLKEHHFVMIEANWNDKATNIKRIVDSLNIGIESIVFADDSAFECDLVRKVLPEVEVLHLQGDPWSWKYLWRGLFDTLSFSDEDARRTEMYRADAYRKEIQSSSPSLEAYLRGLSMVATVGKATYMESPRIAQLTQKTNQFNLTTRRYTEDQIRSMIDANNVDVFYLKLRDKISDLGIVGVAVVIRDWSEARIDTFLLSCRALGRDVENAFLSYVLNSERDSGIILVRGEYVPSNKNNQVSNFYENQGFVDNEIVLNRQFEYPDWIEIEAE